MKKIVLTLVSLTLFCFSLTVLFLSMRSVLMIGGFCAQGGAYVIRAECPQGVAYLVPLSILGLLVGTGLYFFFSASFKNSPRWGYLSWSALFLALGWNFLEFGAFHGPISIAWLICALFFGFMGLSPLFYLNVSKRSLVSVFIGGGEESNNSHSTTVEKFYESRVFLILLHLVGLAGGIHLGMWIVYYM